MYEDWALIEASFAKQYGIRLRGEDDMSWGEFTTLLSGIMPETPLGKIISTRSEDDPDILKTFNKEQNRIRNEWHSRIRKQLMNDKGNAEAMIEQFQSMMKNAFS